MSEIQHWKRPAHIPFVATTSDRENFAKSSVSFTFCFFLVIFLLKKVHIVIEHSVHQMLTLCVVVQLALYRLAALDGEHSFRFGKIH